MEQRDVSLWIEQEVRALQDSGKWPRWSVPPIVARYTPLLWGNADFRAATDEQARDMVKDVIGRASYYYGKDNKQ